MPCFIIIYLLFHPTLSTDSLTFPATFCRLQSALRGSTGTAAASHVRSVCTALGRAIMSQATVSACLASLALCVTKASSLVCLFDLLPAVSLTVKFIHCEILVFAIGKWQVKFISENVLAFYLDRMYKSLYLNI